ncbi:conserved hypothetical protein, partial [Ricinus communis]
MVVALNIAYCAGKYAERSSIQQMVSKKKDLTPNLSNCPKPEADPEVSSSGGEDQGDGQAAAFAVAEGDAAAVGFGDFARQRQAEARAAALRRVEGDEGVRQHGVVHARATVEHVDADDVLHPSHVQLDVFRPRAGFVGVLQQVEQRLFHLRAVDAGRRLRQLSTQAERDLVRQPGHE